VLPIDLSGPTTLALLIIGFGVAIMTRPTRRRPTGNQAPPSKRAR